MTTIFWALKGGIGKTCLAVHFFRWASAHRRLCLLDADEQSTAMKWLSENRYNGEAVVRFEQESGPDGSIATSHIEHVRDYENLIVDGSPRSDFLDALTEHLSLPEGWQAVLPVGERYSLEGAQEAVPEIRKHGGQSLLVVNGPDVTTRIGRRTVVQAHDLAARLDVEIHRRVITDSKVIRQAADRGVPAWKMGWARNSRSVLALNLLCHELFFGRPADGPEYEYTSYQQDQMRSLMIENVLS